MHIVCPPRCARDMLHYREEVEFNFMAYFHLEIFSISGLLTIIARLLCFGSRYPSRNNSSKCSVKIQMYKNASQTHLSMR